MSRRVMPGNKANAHMNLTGVTSLTTLYLNAGNLEVASMLVEFTTGHHEKKKKLQILSDIFRKPVFW